MRITIPKWRSRRRFLQTARLRTAWCDESGSIVIPKRGSVCPPVSVEPFNMTIIGYPGVGKSSALSVLPDSFVIDCQISPGYKFLKHPRTAHVVSLAEREGIYPHEAFLEIIAQWLKDPSTFLIVDPLTEVLNWAETYATLKFKQQPQGMGKLASIDSVLDIPGKDENTGSRGWSMMYSRFMELMREVWARRETRTIFVGHVRDAMLTDDQKHGAKSGILVDDKDLDLTGKLKGIFLSENDSACYMYRDAITGKLMMNFAMRKGGGGYLKNRCPRLMGKNISFDKPVTNEDWVPASIDDWRQIYPETLERLAPSKPISPPATAATTQQTNKP